MPQRDEAPLGAPCWVDVSSSDTDKTVAFYTDLFGWTASPPNEALGGYINFSRDGRLVAGCTRNDPQSGAPDGWTVYLAPDDAEKTTAKAAENGGQVLLPPLVVSDLGTMAIVADPGGNVIGIWQPGTHKGFGTLAEPGAPSWFEVHTRAYAATVAFYQDVFGWQTSVMSDTPEFRYTTLGEGAEAMAGIMDASDFPPDQVPNGWSVYFGVADADAAAARIVELGGGVVQPPEDTPYGRLAKATDSTGAAFKIVASPAS